MQTAYFEPAFGADGTRIVWSDSKKPVMLRGGVEWTTAETDPEKASLAIHQALIAAGGFDRGGWMIEEV